MRQLWIIFVLPGLFAVSGCSTGNWAWQQTSQEQVAQPYASEIADPAAKALYAFVEFRLKAAENRWGEALPALERAVFFDPQSDYLKVLLAKTYLHTQKQAQAVTVLTELIERSPENVEARELLGDIYSLEKNYPAAVEQYRKVLELAADNQNVRLRLAMVLSRLDRPEEAIATLETLLEQQPDANIARLALARFYLNQGKVEQARETYRQVLELDPGQQQAIVEYGKLLEKDDPAGALQLYLDAIATNPRAAAVRQQLSQYYLDHGQIEEALAQLQELRWQFPDNLQLLGQIGLLQLDLQNWQSAEKEFRNLLQSTTDQDRYRYYLAMALIGQKRIDEASKELLQVPRRSAVYVQARLQLAYLYNDSERRQQAVATLEDLLAGGADDPEAYYYLVAFLGEGEDFSKAVDYARQGITKHPHDTRLLYQLGVLYEKLDRRSDAVKTMEQILTLDAEHPDALNFLAYDQAETGTDLPLALERAQKAFAKKPSGYIVDTLGWVYYKMGRYAESRKQLEEATRQHPDDPVINEHLGDLYRAMKLWEQAATVYRRVLELDPSTTGVADKLRAVEQEAGQ
ncbi:tetratricopeptide repeat protein [Pelobacter seleniigenes]|uniref:tetratricopeptide repeat protein n=1 Tax=Pelobacter seleniigenes TaxID=407188 RepID=UPI000A002691|nr:tetratricopeptide repeat protein [Pelobacter seleniigenes]